MGVVKIQSRIRYADTIDNLQIRICCPEAPGSGLAEYAVGLADNSSNGDGRSYDDVLQNRPLQTFKMSVHHREAAHTPSAYT